MRLRYSGCIRVVSILLCLLSYTLDLFFCGIYSFMLNRVEYRLYGSKSNSLYNLFIVTQNAGSKPSACGGSALVIPEFEILLL
jgi:hypothetical protein